MPAPGDNENIMFHSFQVSVIAVILLLSFALRGGASGARTIDWLESGVRVLRDAGMGCVLAIVFSSILGGTWREVGTSEQLMAGQWHEIDAAGPNP